MNYSFTLMAWCAVVTGITATLSCSGQKNDPKSKNKAEVSQETQAEPLIPVVTDKSENLLFSFLNEEGRIQSVSNRSEVPESIRARVLVVDLAKTPEQRQSHRFAFFVDLSESDHEGAYPVTVVSRYDAASGERAPVALAPVPDGTVVLYTAEWCGYCKKAKRWLSERQVPFVERDIEKTPEAQIEMKKKLVAAGVQGGGVPVIDWNGELVMGFDQRKLTELYEKLEGKASSPHP